MLQGNIRRLCGGGESPWKLAGAEIAALFRQLQGFSNPGGRDESETEGEVQVR